MGFAVHFGDKLIPGMQHAVGVATDVGKPHAKVRVVGGPELATHVERLDLALWKVRFTLPKDAKGELEVEVTSGPHKATEKKTIG